MRLLFQSRVRPRRLGKTRLHLIGNFQLGKRKSGRNKNVWVLAPRGLIPTVYTISPNLHVYSAETNEIQFRFDIQIRLCKKKKKQ